MRRGVKKGGGRLRETVEWGRKGCSLPVESAVAGVCVRVGGGGRGLAT